MLQSYRYPLKIWLTGLLCGPLLIIVLSYRFLNFKEIGEPFIFYGMMVIFGSLTALPCLLIMWVLTYFLARTSLTQQSVKHLLAVVCLILSYTLLLAISVSAMRFWGWQDTVMTVSYGIPTVLGCYIFRTSIQQK